MFTIIAAAVILAAVAGGVVTAIRRSHSQACIDKRLCTFCSRYDMAVGHLLLKYSWANEAVF